MTRKTLLLLASLLFIFISVSVFGQQQEPVFPKNPPKGFYLKDVVFHFPGENRVIHGLKYGMGQDPGPDTIELRSFIHRGTHANDDTVFYLLAAAPGEQYFLKLESGTSFMVNAGSFLQMANCWQDNKILKIRGEVFLQAQDSIAIDIEGIMLCMAKGATANISNYADEPYYTISDEKGAVQIEHPSMRVRLQPRLELWGSKTSKKIFTKTSNISEIRAWVNGEQRRSDFDDAMRQIRRWYNCRIVFPAGEITNASPVYFPYRTTSLDEMLALYQKANPKIDFQLINKAIVIRAKRTDPSTNNDDRFGTSNLPKF